MRSGTLVEILPDNLDHYHHRNFNLKIDTCQKAFTKFMRLIPTNLEGKVTSEFTNSIIILPTIIAITAKLSVITTSPHQMDSTYPSHCLPHAHSISPAQLLPWLAVGS